MKYLIFLTLLLSTQVRAAEDPAATCQLKWSHARIALQKLENHPDGKAFEEFKRSIPSRDGDLVFCENLRWVLTVFETRLSVLSKSAPQVFDYAQVLVRIQPFSDGAVAESICSEGPVLTMRNAEDFLRALKTGGTPQILNCFFGYPAKNPKIYQDRLQALRRVKSKDLRELRNEAIATVRAAM